MKARMKKATFMLFHGDVEKILNHLQEKGIVHVDIDAADTGAEAGSHLKYLHKIESILQEMNPEHVQSQDLNADEVVVEYESLGNQIEILNETKDKLQKEFRQLKPWGNINWKKITKIEENHWKFSFYIAPQNAFEHIENDPFVVEVNRHGGNVYFINISPENDETIFPFEQLHLPKMPLGEVGKELGLAEEKISKLQHQMFNLSRYFDVLKRHYHQKLDELMIENAGNSLKSTAQGKIKFIQAWFPTDIQATVEKELSELDLFYEIYDPSETDDVPIVLKNNSYSKIFENITKVYQLPNYRELDLTPFIGVFYPIFFAYCLGDTGYGIVLTLIAIWALFGPLKKSPGIAWLGIVLGILTAIMGIVKSGTVFGLSIMEVRNIPIFDTLSRYIFITDDQNFIFNAFNVSLMIGLFQILVGVVLAFYRKLKYQSLSMALPMLAKFLIIISSVSLFLGASQGMDILVPFIGISKISLLLGISGLLLSHDFSIPVFSRVLKGLLEVFFVFTGILGDSLSYIRLFALGVSSSILGLVVNQIGAPLFENGILGIIGGILFLIFGHSLNFAIAFLGALIHPLRLTFVEFYGNAQFEGGGKEFIPFKKSSQNL